MNQIILKSWKLFCAFVVLLGVSTDSNANVPTFLLNPSFEAGLTSWDHDGSVYVLGPPNQVAIGTDGSHSANMGTFNLPNAFLAQGITLQPATTYLLEFDSAANAVAVVGKIGQVQAEVFDSTSVLLASGIFTDVSPGNLQGALGFTARSLEFTTPASSGSVKLKFSDVSLNNGLAVDENIDNVRLTAVPEPGSVALLSLGVAGLLVHRWQKRSRR